MRAASQAYRDPETREQAAQMSGRRVVTTRKAESAPNAKEEHVLRALSGMVLK